MVSFEEAGRMLDDAAEALPELKSSNFAQRSFGERVALNMPIQGTAADVIKLAMVHVAQRLEREKRCGRVEQLDDRHWRYTAQVYDALEMLPWIRTFTGRIVELKCDDPRVTERFRQDIAALARLYGGDGDAVQ